MSDPGFSLANRVVLVSFQFGDEVISFDQNFAMYIEIMKHILVTQNTANLTIFGVRRDIRQRLLSHFNQFKARKQNDPAFVPIQIQIGRQGQKPFTIYKGQIISCSATNPPDIALCLKCATHQIDKTNYIAQYPAPPYNLKNMVKWAADQMGLFSDTTGLTIDPVIPNFRPRYLMSALPMVLQMFNPNQIACYVDDDTLVCKDIQGMIDKNNIPQVSVSAKNLIGVPAWTEWGLQAQALADTPVKLGGGVAIKSVTNTDIDGTPTVIIRLDYQISTRDNPFYVNIYSCPAASS